MKKEVLVFLLSDFADWEASYVAAEINNKSANNPYCIKKVSITGEMVTSMGGFKVMPDYALNDIPKEVAAFILVGGTGWRSDLSHQVVPTVKHLISEGIPLAAICDATVFMAKNGFLNTGRHTSNDLDDLLEYAQDAYTNRENYIEEPAVMDGNIITANGSSPLEFAKLILTKLSVYTDAQIKEWYDFNKLGEIEAAKLYGYK